MNKGKSESINIHTSNLRRCGFRLYEDQRTIQNLPIFPLCQSDLPLSEFKILDIYLSKIGSYDPEKRTVVFSKKELEEKSGVKKINHRDLEKRLEHLMTVKITIENNSEKKGFTVISLFESIGIRQDKYGLCQIEMMCTPPAMKYFFDIYDINCLKYRMNLMQTISSRYTYIMILYLEQMKSRKYWNVGLKELKQMFSCQDVETYSAFKMFNNQVLKRVQKEMFEKTDYRFSYKFIKRGRTVIGVRFHLICIPKFEPIVEELMKYI